MDTINRRRIIFGLFLIYAIGFGSYTLYRAMLDRPFFMEEPAQACGIVKYKGDRDQVHKHSTYTEFILVIARDGYLYDETVSLGAYNNYEVGDRYCTDNKHISNKIFWAGPAFVLAIFFWILLGIAITADVFFGLWTGEIDQCKGYLTFLFSPLTRSYWLNKEKVDKR